MRGWQPETMHYAKARGAVPWRVSFMDKKIKLAVCALAALTSAVWGKTTMEPTALQLSSESFKAGEGMPSRCGYQNENISPELHWTGVPEKTKTFAIICDDPDAPGRIWVHWVIYDIPIEKEVFKKTFQLLENFPKKEISEKGIRQGMNDFGKIGYDGPAPPSGVHRYYFKLYALDTALELKPGAGKHQLLAAMKGHILAETQLMGTYGR
jgi:Raf kinase inhibitor-like YbhB/YbcL family protein